MNDQEYRNEPGGVCRAMVEQSSNDLSCVIKDCGAFGDFAGNEAQHARGEHAPSKSLPFRSVEHSKNRMGEGPGPSIIAAVAFVKSASRMKTR